MVEVLCFKRNTDLALFDNSLGFVFCNALGASDM